MEQTSEISYKDKKQKIEDTLLANLKQYSDFPKPGVVFTDLFSLTAVPSLFRLLVDGLKMVVAEEVGESGKDFNAVVGLDARGFIFGSVLALEWGVPFLPVRKKGKLPGEVIGQTYDLEYG